MFPVSSSISRANACQQWFGKMAVKYEKLCVRRGLSLGTCLGENTFAKTGSAGQGSSRKVKAGLVGIFMALHAPIKSRLREHILFFYQYHVANRPKHSVLGLFFHSSRSNETVETFVISEVIFPLRDSVKKIYRASGGRGNSLTGYQFVLSASAKLFRPV